MGVAYRLMYRLGFTPWDRMFPSELADIITGSDALAPGRALDLGSGKGTKAIFMATHGWTVTAVEAVPRAVAEARRRASGAGVQVDFRLGDVTRLDELQLAPGYTLIFDFGCFHGLKPKERDAYTRGVNAVAAPGAKLLMMAFTRPVPPVTRGVTGGELAERLGPGWKLDWARPSRAEGTTAMSRGAAGWFLLTRNS